MTAFHGKLPEPPAEEKRAKRMFSRSQFGSMLLAGMLFLYSLLSSDIALSFLTISFLLFMLHPLGEKIWGKTLSNVMKGMAMGMGFGALIMAFL